MKRWRIHLDNYEYAGIYEDYIAIAETSEELEGLCQDLAYTMFHDQNCEEQMVQDRFPDWEEENLDFDELVDSISDEIDSAYYYTIKEWDDEDEEEWDWFEIIYDASED